MNLFLKEYSTNNQKIIFLIWMMATFILLLVAYKQKEFATWIVVLLVGLTFIMIVSTKHFNGRGLYIEGQEMYYKSSKLVPVDVEKLAGIKVTKAVGSGGRYIGFYDIVDTSGQKIYVAIFLNKVESGMKDQQRGNLWFNSQFKSCVMFETIYDKEIIDYIKTLNPNIIVMD